MTDAFLTILDMSLTASWVILVVTAVRFFLRRIPRKYICLLWLAVLFRLLCPAAPSAGFSLVPDIRLPELVTESALEFEAAPEAETEPDAEAGADIEAKDGTELKEISAPQSVSETTEESSEDLSSASQIGTAKILLLAGTGIWLLGILLLISRNLAAYLSLRGKLIKSRESAEKGVWTVPGLETPFVTGIIRPQIYLPQELAKEERAYILLHERTHIRRGDPIAKLVGFLALCLHWFNPLVWLSFYLASADMEMACDEQVISILGEEIRQDYSASLLRLASGRRLSAGLPTAFGEGNPKSRILHILEYKRAGTRTVTAACVILSAVILGLSLNPGKEPGAAVKRESGQLEAVLSFTDTAAPGLTGQEVWSAQAAGERLDELFEELMSSPLEAGNQEAYIEAHPDSFAEIVSLSSNTLAYCFEKFEQGGQTGLKGALMAEACREITGAAAAESKAATGQEWYDTLKVQLPDYTYPGADKALCLLYETERERAGESGEGFRVWAIRVHGDQAYEESDGEIMRWRIVATVYENTYRLLGDRVYDLGGSVAPVAATYESKNGGKDYELISYEQAQDGSYFLPSIQAFCTMPISGEAIEGLPEEILEYYGQDPELMKLMSENLREHLQKYGVSDAVIRESGLPPRE